jgi:outer membrane protein OmpA-like peptidoglycan-associated protein
MRYCHYFAVLSLVALTLVGCASPAVRDEVNAVVAEVRLPIAQIDRGVLIFLPNQVLFDTGDSHFSEAMAQPYLDKVARLLLDKTDKTVSIEGHTDNVGSAGYNLELSARRAESVQQALIQRGVPMARLKALSFGMDRPVAPNDTEVGRALNRRVELIVLDETVENLTRGEPANSFEAAFEKLRALFAQPVTSAR